MSKETPKRDRTFNNEEAQSNRILWASSFVGNIQHPTSFKFGQSVKKKRQEHGMTQAELAKIAGLNRSYLSDVERGASSISLDRAAKIANVLGCHICDLLKD